MFASQLKAVLVLVASEECAQVLTQSDKVKNILLVWMDTITILHSLCNFILSGVVIYIAVICTVLCCIYKYVT